MENYLVINGKKIELPQSIIDVITKQLEKDRVSTYEDIAKSIERKYYINTFKGKPIDYSDSEDATIDGNEGTSEYQMECLLARNKIVNVANYLNKGWIPNWNNMDEYKFYIRDTIENELTIDFTFSLFGGQVFFKTKELALKAIEILGEVIIRKALNSNFK